VNRGFYEKLEVPFSWNLHTLRNFYRRNRAPKARFADARRKSPLRGGLALAQRASALLAAGAVVYRSTSEVR